MGEIKRWFVRRVVRLGNFLQQGGGAGNKAGAGATQQGEGDEHAGAKAETELEMDTDFESFSFEVRQNYFFDMFDLQYFFSGGS